MEKQNAVATQKEFTTSISEWTNSFTGLVSRDFEKCGVSFDEYSKQCAMSAMTSIYQLIQNSDKADMKELNTSNLKEVITQVASLKLNASAVPRECYFQLRTKKINGQYAKVVEVGIEGDGNDAMLRNFGQGVATVYPCWLVKEGDEFKYPRQVGIETVPPEWEQRGLSEKVVRVVYPIKLIDGSVVYKIAEREGVRINLLAHIKNNLMNETFGICESRYKATDKQKSEIDAKKSAILSEVRACKTVDEILECKNAIPYISAAWLDTPESMIVRKMRNNAIKKFPKDMNSIASKSFMEMDETYENVQEEIQMNANKEAFIEADEPIQEAEKVQGEVVEPDGNQQSVDDWMKK